MQSRMRPCTAGVSAAWPTTAVITCNGGQEGVRRGSIDARKPQNPTNSEEYQGHLQGVSYST
eukprot:1713657-Pyramimonas_sp.AAC.1